MLRFLSQTWKQGVYWWSRRCATPISENAPTILSTISIDKKADYHRAKTENHARKCQGLARLKTGSNASSEVGFGIYAFSPLLNCSHTLSPVLRFSGLRTQITKESYRETGLSRKLLRPRAILQNAILGP